MSEDTNTVVDLDPGINRIQKNRRIMSTSQVRNEIMVYREKTTRDEVVVNLFCTNTRATDDNTFLQNERRQQAAGFPSMQFHYHINTNGFTFTGLELAEPSALNNGDNICIGVAGGLRQDGVLPARHTLSDFSVEQVDALVSILGQFVLTFDKVRIVKHNIDAREGISNMNVVASEIRNRVDRRLFKDG